MIDLKSMRQDGTQEMGSWRALNSLPGGKQELGRGGAD